jgi:hypothetical protein
MPKSYHLETYQLGAKPTKLDQILAQDHWTKFIGEMLSLNNIIVGVKIRQEKRLRGQNRPTVFIKQSTIMFE